MHYIPESSRRLLEGDSPQAAEQVQSQTAYHLTAAPLYLLTAAVGGLLLADVLLSAAADPGAAAWRTLFGLRLALLAAVLGGARILYHTLDGLLQGRIGADFALTLACVAALLLGEHAVAALVVFIALCGESIEGYTVDRARSAIRRVFDLCPRHAHVEINGQVADVPIDDLAAGQICVVRPGERIPADGVVISGESSVDQSPLTGESFPVDKAPGETLFAGTLNQLGVLRFRVERAGAATACAQIARLVAQATQRKARLERLADRLSRYFLPAVLLAALLTLAAWRLRSGTWQAGFMPALAVLVVACPCPLVLATPCAVMAAMAWLARNGVVIKGSAALERLAHIDTVAFDKTGTLTQGQPGLTTLVPAPRVSNAALLALAAAAEQSSDHPMGRRVVGQALALGVEVPPAERFVQLPGLGVAAVVDPGLLPEEIVPLLGAAGDARLAILVGNQRLLEACGLPLNAEWRARAAECDGRGESAFYVALAAESLAARLFPDARQEATSHVQQPPPQGGSLLLGLLGARDVVRPEAAAVMRDLRGAGVAHLALLTGDRQAAAAAVLAEVEPFDTLLANQLPADKARWIEQRMQAGHGVAMVGDGINDAPALAAATVGIALGRAGSDLASEAGDVIFMGDPLAPLPGLLRLSRKLVHVITQGIYLFAFSLNGLGVLLSAWGLLSPVTGALFHEAASLAVMLNALRLLWFEGWQTTRAGRWMLRAAAQADRLAGLLAPVALLQRARRHRRMLLKLACAAALGCWCPWNLVLIRGDEAAVVWRCGKYRQTLPSGLHWRWPPPFETLARRQVARLRLVQVGFRASPARPGLPGEPRRPIEWQAEHADGDYRPVPAESLALTGDELAVEVSAQAHFQIARLRDYLENSRAPEALLQALTESALRQVLAGLPLEAILAEARAAVEEDCLRLVRQGSLLYGLGVDVSEVRLLDLHPPAAVVPAYRNVANALEEQEQSINLAHVASARYLLRAAGEQALGALIDPGRDNPAARAGLGLRTDLTNWQLDGQLWRKLVDESAGEAPLAGESAARVHAALARQARSMGQARARQGRFEALLATHASAPRLTNVELFWQAVERALEDRPLTLLDPRAAGRRHMILGEPERWNLPWPARLPPDRQDDSAEPPPIPP